MKYFPNFYPTKSKKIESCYLSWLLTWIKFVIIHINCNCCHQHSKPDLLANLHPHYIKPSNSRCHFPTHPFSWGCPFKSPLTRSPRHLILDSLIQHSDRSSVGSLFQSRSADEESTPPTWGGQDWQSPTRSDLNFKSRSHSDRLNLFPQKPGKTRLLLILATKRLQMQLHRGIHESEIILSSRAEQLGVAGWRLRELGVKNLGDIFNASNGGDCCTLLRLWLKVPIGRRLHSLARFIVYARHGIGDQSALPRSIGLMLQYFALI